MVKNAPGNAGDVGSIPGLGKFPGVGNGNLLQYSCLGNSMDRGGVGYRQWNLKASDTTEWLSTCTHTPVRETYNKSSGLLLFPSPSKKKEHTTDLGSQVYTHYLSDMQIKCSLLLIWYFSSLTMEQPHWLWSRNKRKKNKIQSSDFPGGPVAKTCTLRARGPGSIPGQGTRSHMLQLKSSAAK